MTLKLGRKVFYNKLKDNVEAMFFLNSCWPPAASASTTTRSPCFKLSPPRPLFAPLVSNSDLAYCEIGVERKGLGIRYIKGKIHLRRVRK
jgi:hypothetical protein